MTTGDKNKQGWRFLLQPTSLLAQLVSQLIALQGMQLVKSSNEKLTLIAVM
jgi:hypothetical protein